MNPNTTSKTVKPCPERRPGGDTLSFDATVLNVLIASPGDTLRERDMIEGVVHAWNRDRSRQSQVVLLPLRWETDAVSQLGRGDGQSMVNEQLVDEADIVFGVFHSRLGSSTPRAVSGTVEELERGIGRNLHVHLYFSRMQLPAD